MDYEGQICRTSMERGSYMLPVAVGCAYNGCLFCTLFKHLTYRELPLEQIEAELIRVKQAGGDPKRVFLGDGNAFGMETDRLLTIIDLLRRYFPGVESIRMDATITNIGEKSDEQLHLLRQAGIECLYLGIESGLDDVLRLMNKDHTLQQAYDQIGRIRSMGYTYAAHIMTGIAGAGRGLENAEATAAFLNRTGPVSVTNFSLFLHKKAPLYRRILVGKFVPADELENLREGRRLVELLQGENLLFDGFHDMLPLRVKGQLPRDREKMLQKMDAAIAEYSGREAIYSYINNLPECGCAHN